MDNKDKDYFETQQHHIHPKFMNNKKGLGRKYMLETKEHIILHLKIPSIIWKYVPKTLKHKCINEVISFSEKYINNLKENDNIDLNNFIKDYEEESYENKGIVICNKCKRECDIEDEYCECSESLNRNK